MAAWLDELFKSRLFPTDELGIYGKDNDFESIVEALIRSIIELGKDQQAERMSFPPVLTLTAIKKSGYLSSFPQLAGTIHSFCGSERDHRTMLKCIGEDDDSWTEKQESTGTALTPAACYPVYPVMAARGVVPDNGYMATVCSYCFRNEPSNDPMRMRSFRMYEYIRIGSPEQVEDFRNLWITRGQQFAECLMLPYEVDVANDPFFGRGGQIVADAQREQKLKFELLIPVIDEKLAACLSFNYHMDHFGEIYDMKMKGGSFAHTACVGFGLERLTIALFKHHGIELKNWPERVLKFLWPNQ